MIITRTPFRISFFGGGTDFPAFYKEYGGSVLSTTINKYCYIISRNMPPFFDYKYRMRYSSREETATIDEIKHPVVREVLKKFQYSKGLEMVHTSDIPAMSGIGSSSAFTVGFLHGMYALQGKMITKRQLAQEAVEIEQDVLKENVGSQDQVATAFGGFNRIDFKQDGNFYVSPVTIPAARLNELEGSLMLFFTGFTRFSSEIAEDQVKSIPGNVKNLLKMKSLVDDAIDILNGNAPMTDFGKLLHETWLLKKSLSLSISTSYIEDAYNRAVQAGAEGGKVLGAGGGGFMLMYVEPEKQAAVKAALSDLLYVPFSFELLGSQIIMYSTIEY
jgi:D-glycero-alpha-D-manno-heptose-7-phosphate kinase